MGQVTDLHAPDVLVLREWDEYKKFRTTPPKQVGW